MRKRKASLSLSVNAIVVLVLALTMLGVGIAFTKGMLGNLSEKISVPEAPVTPATSNSPVQVTNEGSIKCNSDSMCSFSISLFNKNVNDASTFTASASCKGSVEKEDPTWLIHANTLEIPKRSAGILKVGVSGIPAGTFDVCVFTFKPSGTGMDNIIASVTIQAK